MRLTDYRNIYFACTGNTCRSPMAEKILNEELIKRGFGGINVESRAVGMKGIKELLGKKRTQSTVVTRNVHFTPPRKFGQMLTREAMEVLQAEYGDDLFYEEHRSTDISYDDLEVADIVITMSHEHKKKLVSEPEAYGFDRNLKVYTLGELAGLPNHNVMDPMTGGASSSMVFGGHGVHSVHSKPTAGKSWGQPSSGRVKHYPGIDDSDDGDSDAWVWSGGVDGNTINATTPTEPLDKPWLKPSYSNPDKDEVQVPIIQLDGDNGSNLFDMNVVRAALKIGAYADLDAEAKDAIIAKWYADKDAVDKDAVDKDAVDKDAADKSADDSIDDSLTSLELYMKELDAEEDDSGKVLVPFLGGQVQAEIYGPKPLPPPKKRTFIEERQDQYQAEIYGPKPLPPPKRRTFMEERQDQYQETFDEIHEMINYVLDLDELPLSNLEDMMLSKVEELYTQHLTGNYRKQIDRHFGTDNDVIDLYVRGKKHRARNLIQSRRKFFIEDIDNFEQSILRVKRTNKPLNDYFEEELESILCAADIKMQSGRYLDSNFEVDYQKIAKDLGPALVALSNLIPDMIKDANTIEKEFTYKPLMNNIMEFGVKIGADVKTIYNNLKRGYEK